MADLRIKYDLRISEAQRHYLLVALKQCQLQDYYGADVDGKIEIDDLEAMLGDDANLTGLVDPAAPYNAASANTLNDFTA